MNHFGDFAREEGLSGDKISISDLFGKVIIVNAYRKLESRAVQGKTCVQIQIILAPIPQSSSDSLTITKICYRLIAKLNGATIATLLPKAATKNPRRENHDWISEHTERPRRL